MTVTYHKPFNRFLTVLCGCLCWKTNLVCFLLDHDPGAAGIKGQGEESQANLPAPTLQTPSTYAACTSAPILYEGLQISMVWF